MRKHRLAERLLVDVIGLPWEQVHSEACRWEHVMSEAVERRLVDILGHPTVSPFGNPIPGLAALSDDSESPTTRHLPGPTLAVAAQAEPRTVEIVLIAEILQADEAAMGQLRDIGAVPGQQVEVARVDDRVELTAAAGSVELTLVQAGRIVVAD